MVRYGREGRLSCPRSGERGVAQGQGWGEGIVCSAPETCSSAWCPSPPPPPPFARIRRLADTLLRAHARSPSSVLPPGRRGDRTVTLDTVGTPSACISYDLALSASVLGKGVRQMAVALRRKLPAAGSRRCRAQGQYGKQWPVPLADSRALAWLSGCLSPARKGKSDMSPGSFHRAAACCLVKRGSRPCRASLANPTRPLPFRPVVPASESEG